jgi:hypothetical protein
MACRKRGEIMPDDIMTISEVEGRPELTGAIAWVIERAAGVEEANLWKVECVLGDTAEPLQVPAVSLLRFRPLW